MAAAELAVALLLGQLPWLPARCRHRVAVSALPQRCRREDQRFLAAGWAVVVDALPVAMCHAATALAVAFAVARLLLPTCYFGYLLLLTSYLLLPTFYFLERGVGYPPPADLR